MNSLIKTTIKRPVTICVLVVILLAVGVLATMDMSTNLLPNIKMPMMGITVVYPGAGARSVEDDVTAPMETALKTITGLNELETISYDNVAIAILTFDYGTDIDAKIDAIEDTFKTVNFPQGCEDPLFTKIDMNGTASATITVYNESNDWIGLEQLAKDADALATKLRSIEGVGSVNVMGSPENQLKITGLQGLDITSLAIVQALSKENLDLPLGTILQDGSVVSIRNASSATSVLDVMRLPVSMDLGASAITSMSTLQNAVKVYATCTTKEFEDYVDKALKAKEAIDEIDGKKAVELEELQDNLAAVKSLMGFVRENTSQSIRAMWRVIELNVVGNEEFVNMNDDDLEAFANQLNMPVGVLKWLRDGCQNDGESLHKEWFKLADFRAIFPYEDTNDDGEVNGDDITYDQFATLFQDGGTVTVTVNNTDDEGNVTTSTEEKTYEGLDLLHSVDNHAENCNKEGDEPCDRETFTHDEAVNACEFADSVNTVAFQNIIDVVAEADEKRENGETVEEPVISDELFARLFINTTQGNDFAALMSPQVIHIIRLEHFNADVNGKESIVRVLRETKQARVDDEGNAIYKNKVAVARNDDNEIVVVINDKEYKVNTFGRLVNADKKLISDKGEVLNLTSKQIEENYYSYGEYIVFDDDELLALYNRLNLGDTEIGITPTLDTVRFIRICDFSEDATKLVVPVAYVGKVDQIITHQAYSQYNGKPAVTVEVYAVADANTTKVVNAVKKSIAEVKVSGSVKLLDDKAEFINDSIANVLSSIVIGGVLAILVIYLFVGKLGSSLVVSITMPLSVLVAILGMWAMKISLNLVSLGGLAVGIGMLVDNSIVVLESITKRRDRGESVFDSCWHGTREVAGSLLASTLTNICVFFPILFARGLTREIFYDLVWAVLFSIVMSLLVAVTVIPSLYHLIYSRSPRPRYKKDANGNKVLVGTFEDGEPRAEVKPLYDDKQNNGAVKTDASATADTAQEVKSDGGKKRFKKDKAERKRNVLYRMENGYGKLLSKVLTKRVIVCAVAFVLFGASVGLVFTTGVDFIPSVDKGVIEVNMRFGSSATLEDVDNVTQQAVSAIREAYGENIKYTSYTVGKQGMLPMNNTGLIRIQIDNTKLKTSQTVDDIRTLLESKKLDVKNVSVTEIDGVVAELTGEMAGQSVTLLGDDEQKLAEAAGKIAAKLKEIDGIKTVTDNTPTTTKQYSFKFDRDECARRGVDYQNAVLLLRVGMSGYTAANVTIEGESQEVFVQFVDATKDDVNELINVIVGFDDDGVIKVADVLQKTDGGELYSVDDVVSVVNRKDGKFVTTVDIESYGVDMGTINKRVNQAVAEVLADNPDVTFEEGGVSYYLTDAMNGLVISLIAAFLLLYGVMACQFESLVKPFIVIMSIPFSFTGGFLALVITGTTLNVVSFVGIIMLMGVIVNGAIVMIDKIDQLIKDGVEPHQAVLEGCKSRLRPILMTTLTTILALTPLAIGIGRGSELMQPMGIVVLGGLLLGTLVTLVLIPCFYCIVKRIKFGGKVAADGADVSTDDVADKSTDNDASQTEDASVELSNATADVTTSNNDKSNKK